jgi:hypothetical protein
MSNQSIDALAKKTESMRSRFERVEKEVRGLKDLLNTHDNWHSTIREWIGQQVTICDCNGSLSQGVLKWSDRYNVCISPDAYTPDTHKLRIYTKGGINWIEPV